MSKAAYRIREAAEIASVTESDITDAIKAGELTARRIRDTYVIPHACVLAWLDSLPEFYATD